MQQTFDDLSHERKRQTAQGFFGFVLWMFVETAIGIVQERLRLITKGARMHIARTTFGPSAVVSVLFMLPLIILEVVNRRTLNEAFPFVLFFVLWLNVLAISLLLLSIAHGTWSANQDTAAPVPTQGTTLLTNPRSTVLISVLLLLSPGILPVLDSVGWLSLDRLFNGPNPEVAYLPGQIISLSLIVFPVAAGMIAGGPIVNTLRAGGSLFVHPLHLLIVVVLSCVFTIAVVSLIVDQWPCFIGVPNCD